MCFLVDIPFKAFLVDSSFKVFSAEYVIVYAVIVHQTNISYSNGVPSAKHV